MRSFTIVKINSSDRRVKSKSVGGRFQSSSPASAAKKAGSSVCRLNNINSYIKFKIAIRETTQGSSHKIFAYNFARVRNPITVMRSGKKITYEFETKVKSLHRSARHDGSDELWNPNSNLYPIIIGDDDDDDPLRVFHPLPPPPPPPLPIIGDDDDDDPLPIIGDDDDDDPLPPPPPLPRRSGSGSGDPGDDDLYDIFDTQYVPRTDKNYKKKQGICPQQTPFFCGKDSHKSKIGRCARKAQDCKAEGAIAQRGDDKFKYGDLANDFLYKAMLPEERAKMTNKGDDDYEDDFEDDIIDDITSYDDEIDDDTFNTQLVDEKSKNYGKSEWCRSQVPYYCGDKSHPSKKGRCVRQPKDCKYKDAPAPSGKDDNYIYGDLSDDYLYKAMPKEERAKIAIKTAGIKSDSIPMVNLRKAADTKKAERLEFDFTVADKNNRNPVRRKAKQPENGGALRQIRVDAYNAEDYGKRRRKSSKKRSSKKRSSKKRSSKKRSSKKRSSKKRSTKKRSTKNSRRRM